MTQVKVNRSDLRIFADPKKVLLRPLLFGLDPLRIKPVIDHVLQLDEEQVSSELRRLDAEFGHRHFDFKGQCMQHYEKLQPVVNAQLGSSQKLLAACFFSHEYSTQASALFNPSIVPLDMGEKAGDDSQTFLLSLRATGEGHISSLAFQTGKIKEDGSVVMEEPSPLICEGEISPIKRLPATYVSSFFKEGLPGNPGDSLTEEEARNLLPENAENATTLRQVFSNCYQISFSEDVPLSARVIFPHNSLESNGIEDVRFVKPDDEDFYLGTYTAYNGRSITAHLIKTRDFLQFEIFPIAGKANEGKGFAFFPRKINGLYHMIGRQDGRNLFIMRSADLLVWEAMDLLQHPQFTWDMLQIGNNGSPIETPAGWLLLTHAVGPMRKYTLSFSLLDLENPARVLAVLNKPLMEPNEEEREGYVPNVLYTCGLMRHGDTLYIPYAMSDSAIGFATVNVQDLLSELTQAHA